MPEIQSTRTDGQRTTLGGGKKQTDHNKDGMILKEQPDSTGTKWHRTRESQTQWERLICKRYTTAKRKETIKNNFVM